MWNKPTSRQLAKIPRLYETEGIPAQDRMIHLHFFIGNTHWYIAEYSPENRLFFGYTILNGDLQCAEWGYISFDELLALRVGPLEVDRDLLWEPKRFAEIERGWR